MDQPCPSPASKKRAAHRVFGSLDAFAESGPILGRRVANTAFLSALLKADPFDAYHFYLPDDASVLHLSAWIGDRFPALLRRNALSVRLQTDLLPCLADTAYHCFHLSDALTRFTQLAQARNAVSPVLFPITGVTHSLSYVRFLTEFARHLWPGTSCRDAIITTSASASLVLEKAFAGLRSSLGLEAERFPQPLLERIPLGIDPAALPGPADRWDQGETLGKAMRDRLKLGSEPVLLCLARFSPSSKMDLMPLIAAFARAEALGLPKKGYALILSGWADEDDALPEALRGYAVSRGITVRLLLRPDDEEKRALFAAADVFVSPSDNIQETFGLTVAEAGLAGLPVIASDFDGYRDIVAREETGILVPVLGFAHTTETELQSLFWFDNQYHLKLAQQTAVDVPLLAAALHRLGTDKDERARMGARARDRCLAEFSWDAVLRRYTALWDRLAARPVSGEEEARLRQSVHPLRMPFAGIFSGHFSAVLDAATLASMRVKVTRSGEALYREALPPVLYAGMDRFIDPSLVRQLLLAARRETPAAAVVDRLEAALSARLPRPLARERACCTLLWALKQDYLEKS